MPYFCFIHMAILPTVADLISPGVVQISFRRPTFDYCRTCLLGSFTICVVLLLGIAGMPPLFLVYRLSTRGRYLRVSPLECLGRVGVSALNVSSYCLLCAVSHAAVLLFVALAADLTPTSSYIPLQ